MPFLLRSIVSPPTCGCCWDILFWWPYTPWPASSPGSWSSPSLLPRWTHALWASFFSWLQRMFRSPPAHRGRQGRDLAQISSSVKPGEIQALSSLGVHSFFSFLFFTLASRLWDQSAAVLLPCYKLVLLQVYCWWDQCICCQYPLPFDV